MGIVLEITSFFINILAMMNLWLILSLLFGCDMKMAPRNLAIVLGIFFLVYWISFCISNNDGLIMFMIMFAYNVVGTLVLTNKKRIKVLLLELPALLVYLQFGIFMDLFERICGLDRYHIGAEQLTPSDFVTDAVLFTILVMLSRTKVNKVKSIQLTTGEGVVLTIFCFFSPFIIGGLEWFEGIVNENIYKLLWIMFMIILNVAVVYAIAHRKMAAYYRQLSEDYKKEFEAEYSFFRDYRKQQKDTVKFRHDWKNHMLLLQEMLEQGEYGKAEHYFNDLTANTSKSVYKIATGNELMDMILSTKMAALEEHEITLQCKGVLSEFHFMSYVDGCILLSNLIDNAVEANVKVRGAHYIRVTAKKTEGLFYLEITNPMEGVLQQEDGRILTTKAVQEDHGIGLQNVYDIIKKYNGEYHIMTQNREYTMQMIFPVQPDRNTSE